MEPNKVNRVTGNKCTIESETDGSQAEAELCFSENGNEQSCENFTENDDNYRIKSKGKDKDDCLLVGRGKRLNEMSSEIDWVDGHERQYRSSNLIKIKANDGTPNESKSNYILKAKCSTKNFKPTTRKKSKTGLVITRKSLKRQQLQEDIENVEQVSSKGTRSRLSAYFQSLLPKYNIESSELCVKHNALRHNRKSKKDKKAKTENKHKYNNVTNQNEDESKVTLRANYITWLCDERKFFNVDPMDDDSRKDVNETKNRDHKQTAEKKKTKHRNHSKKDKKSQKKREIKKKDSNINHANVSNNDLHDYYKANNGKYVSKPHSIRVFSSAENTRILKPNEYVSVKRTISLKEIHMTSSRQNLVHSSRGERKNGAARVTSSERMKANVENSILELLQYCEGGYKRNEMTKDKNVRQDKECTSSINSENQVSKDSCNTISLPVETLQMADNSPQTSWLKGYLSSHENYSQPPHQLETFYSDSSNFINRQHYINDSLYTKTPRNAYFTNKENCYYNKEEKLDSETYSLYSIYDGQHSQEERRGQDCFLIDVEDQDRQNAANRFIRTPCNNELTSKTKRKSLSLGKLKKLSAVNCCLFDENDSPFQSKDYLKCVNVKNENYERVYLNGDNCEPIKYIHTPEKSTLQNVNIFETLNQYTEEKDTLDNVNVFQHLKLYSKEKEKKLCHLSNTNQIATNTYSNSNSISGDLFKSKPNDGGCNDYKRNSFTSSSMNTSRIYYARPKTSCKQIFPVKLVHSTAVQCDNTMLTLNCNEKSNRKRKYKIEEEEEEEDEEVENACNENHMKSLNYEFVDNESSSKSEQSKTEILRVMSNLQEKVNDLQIQISTMNTSCNKFENIETLLVMLKTDVSQGLKQFENKLKIITSDTNDCKKSTKKKTHSIGDEWKGEERSRQGSTHQVKTTSSAGADRKQCKEIGLMTQVEHHSSTPCHKCDKSVSQKDRNILEKGIQCRINEYQHKTNEQVQSSLLAVEESNIVFIENLIKSNKLEDKNSNTSTKVKKCLPQSKIQNNNTRRTKLKPCIIL